MILKLQISLLLSHHVVKYLTAIQGLHSSIIAFAASETQVRSPELLEESYVLKSDILDLLHHEIFDALNAWWNRRGPIVQVE